MQDGRLPPVRVAYGRLSFEPNVFYRALASPTWSVPLAAVSSVQVTKRRPVSHFFAAGMRRQLCVAAEAESR